MACVFDGSVVAAAYIDRYPLTHKQRQEQKDGKPLWLVAIKCPLDGCDAMGGWSQRASFASTFRCQTPKEDCRFRKGKASGLELLACTGGLRDPPAVFLYFCLWCAYSTPYPFALRHHHLACKGGVPVDPKLSNTVPCADDGCGRTFSSVEVMRSHVARVHSLHRSGACNVTTELSSTTAMRNINAIRTLYTVLWSSKGACLQTISSIAEEHQAPPTHY